MRLQSLASCLAIGIVGTAVVSCGGGGGSPGSGVGGLTTLLTASVPAASTGVAYVTQVDAAFPHSPGSFLITSGALPTGLSLDHFTGLISGYPRQTGVFHFEIGARDGTDLTLPPGRDENFSEDRKAFTVNVALGLPYILPQQPPAAQYRGSYGYQIDEAGGTAPFTFTKTAGTLPNGVTVSSTGFLGNFPTSTQPTPFTFDVTVTDANLLTHTRTLTLTVVVLPLLIFTSNPIPQAAKGFPYDLSLTLASNGGGAPFAWSQVAPIAGETLLSSIGMQITPGGHLSDTGAGPTAPAVGTQTFLFTVQVQDEPLQSAFRQYALTVNPGPVLNSITPNSAAVNGPYLVQGLNFQPGAKMVFKPGATQTLLATTFVSPTQLTFTAPVPKPSNGNGAVPVAVLNPDGGIFTKNAAFIFPATNIAFATKGFISSALSSTGLDVADVNQPVDGYADIVHCGSNGQSSYSGSTTSVNAGLIFLKNLKTSPPTFLPTTLDSGSYYDCKFADVDGNGKLDIVALTLTTVRVWLGNGDGTFSVGPTSALPGLGSGYWPSQLTLGYLDSDLVLDLAFGQPDWPNYSGVTAGNVYTMKGIGGGAFTSMSSAVGNMPTTYGVPSIVCVDTDGDGRAELCAGIGMNSYTGGIFNYSAMGVTGTINGFSSRGTATAGYSTTPGIGVGDFLGLGSNQIATMSTIAPPYGAPGQAFVFSGSGMNNVLSLATPGALVKSCIMFDGDFDAKKEIAVSTSPSSIMIYRGSTQAIALTLNAASGSPAISSPVTGDLGAGDLNGDGAPDLVCTCSYWQTAGMGAYYGPQQGYGTTYCILSSGDGGQLGLVYFLNTSN
jgi:hypothetical protein